MSKETEPRKLNMEEKRRVEKMVVADIEAGHSAFTSARKEKRSKIEKGLLAKPPKAVSTAYRRYIAAAKLAQMAETQLEAMGFSVYKYSTGPCLTLKGYESPEPLKKFDAETAKLNAAFSDLKREYTLKLFAGGEEAQELFAGLTAAIAKLAN